jgi:hypothetical protein
MSGRAPNRWTFDGSRICLVLWAGTFRPERRGRYSAAMSFLLRLQIVGTRAWVVTM